MDYVRITTRQGFMNPQTGEIPASEHKVVTGRIIARRTSIIGDVFDVATDHGTTMTVNPERYAKIGTVEYFATRAELDAAEHEREQVADDLLKRAGLNLD